METKKRNYEIIKIQEQDLEVIFQPNDVLVKNMDIIVGGAGTPGKPGQPGVPGTPGCTVDFGCLCDKLCIFNL